jgi:hypothetical protein
LPKRNDSNTLRPRPCKSLQQFIVIGNTGKSVRSRLQSERIMLAHELIAVKVHRLVSVQYAILTLSF